MNPVRDLDIITEELLLKDIEHVKREHEILKKLAAREKHRKSEMVRTRQRAKFQ